MIKLIKASFIAYALMCCVVFAAPPYLEVDINNNPIGIIDGIPTNGTAVLATSGNVAAAVAAATMPAVAAKTNYLQGFDITGTGATAGQAVVVTITGLLGGTITYTLASATGVAAINEPMTIRYQRPLAASAVNVAIVVSCASLGAGSTNNVTNAFGYVK